MEKFKACPIDGIVKVYDVFVDPKNVTQSYIEMKKYAGNINELLPYTRGEVRKTFKLLLPILHELNKISKLEAPIYHRDIKPDNILNVAISSKVYPSGDPKVMSKIAFLSYNHFPM